MFYYTNWGRALENIEGGLATMRVLHRICAVITFVYAGIHLFYVIKKAIIERKYSILYGPDSMMIRKQDFIDFFNMVRWFFYLGPRPKLDRWTYWEKFDYFAVFWGICVIGSTGLTLWFPEFFTQFMPGWVINVATIIHSDEALLATGFIFTVHFFNTHLRPEKFPMDIVIFSGRIPLEEFKLDRPKEYRELIEKGELEKHLVEAYQPIVIRTIKVFGWIALITGFSIIIWIIYAMIFVYK
jgi:cytochrome b subunit of formate dehydrogenase